MTKNKTCKLLLMLFTLAPLGVEAQGNAKKEPSAEARSEAALQVDGFFWDVFHNGKYELIPDVINALTGIHLQYPNDSVTTAHVGFMKVWHLTERWRQEQFPPTIIEDAVVAQSYFQQAVRLNPDDKRYLGFLGGMTLAEGDIHRDEKLVHKGYVTLRKSIAAFPEFNLVTAGLVESVLPANSDRFKRALEWQWKTLDVCVGEKFDRKNPDMTPYMNLETTVGDKRVCWNGDIAPHNFEGFFFNMGDMLAKAGDWHTAQKIYANARLSKTYDSWLYKDELEQRIVDAEANVALFNEAPGPSGRPSHPVMFQTEYACMSCHHN
ncbi:hypothetical protein [Methylomicrobium lacus]|uniref:hypothetical protein n=1 Tax=Methylomicrobium lacus TaxID=136992 RepID=UPI0035A9513B